MALGDLAIGEIDLGVDAQAADDAGDRVPVHLDELARLGRHLGSGKVTVAMVSLLIRSSLGNLCPPSSAGFGVPHPAA